MSSCLASSSDWMARFSLLSTKMRSCSFSSRRRTFFMLSQPTPWPSSTFCTTSFRNCWFSLGTTAAVACYRMSPGRKIGISNGRFLLPRLTASPGVVDPALGGGRLPGVPLHRRTVLDHRRLLVHEGSRGTSAWRNENRQQWGPWTPHTGHYTEDHTVEENWTHTQRN